ncbi:septum formation initiator family protein [Falsigemmobacter intermedius]|uniref:Septum formation initiator family protein n=1 Tax=Falsigemmobacter intermedius TaxID=1553448 RepID=A0A3S4XZE3_9RHOB|nr:septum formation initiator family protein [Falsigemmobacter intermedius]RWY44620.1 septum formation initiator family protein [Falsigemmobacter intermedius]
MTGTHSSPPVATALWLMCAVAISGYFAFAAMQGDHGIFRRVQISADIAKLEVRKAELEAELARMQNLTERLSDTHLDLDLLDERARVVLGYLRADEVVVQ